MTGSTMEKDESQKRWQELRREELICLFRLNPNKQPLCFIRIGEYNRFL